MLLDGHDPEAIARAAQALADGRLVAFPTETVYGLGARADDDSAVAQIFTAKGRPPNHPLIVHVADSGDGPAAPFASPFALHIPPMAQRLMRAFWPGPLTVIVPRQPAIGAAAAGGQLSIGLRCPSHPVALALLRAAAALGVSGVAAPSANRFGRLSPTRAGHVVQELGDPLWVLDGGDCEVGIESCIVDCSRARPALLRPGVLTRAELEAVLGEALAESDAHAPRASGTLQSHYAPRAALRLMAAPALRTALELLGRSALKLAVYSRDAVAAAAAGASHHVMPGRSDLVAHELFSVLRDFDEQGAQLIWVEEPPATPEWDGVRDRLQRASAA